MMLLCVLVCDLVAAHRSVMNWCLPMGVDFDAVVKLSDGFNGADLRNVCTEAGMFAIRVGRAYTIQEDFMKAARKVAEAKKLESKPHDYDNV